MHVSPNLKLATNKSRIYQPEILLGVILAVAAALRLWHINWGLPEVYEEAYPVSVAWKMWNWGHPGMDFNPHFFNYPALTFYINFLLQACNYFVGYLAGSYSSLDSFRHAFEANPTSFYIVARSSSIAFDIGTIIVLYALGERVAGKNAGLVAATLAAVNPLLISEAHLVNVDTPMTFFAMASLYFALRLLRDPANKWYMLAGASVGLAAASKYTGALLMIGVVAAHLLRSDTFKKALISLADSRLITAIGSAAIVFFITNPYIILSFKEFHDDFSFEEAHMAGGHLGIDPRTSTAGFYLFRVLPSSLGLVCLVISVCSIIWLALRRQERPTWLLLLIPLSYLSVICSWTMRANRYILPVIPMLILLGSIGIISASTWLSEKILKDGDGKIHSKLLYPGIATAIVLITAFQPFTEAISYHESFALPDTRQIAQEWIQKHFPPRSSIVMPPVGITFRDSSYNLLDLPFLPSAAEEMAPFYDPRWFEDFDLVIGSDFDYSRYLQDTVRYRTFINYYASLRRTWNLDFEVKPVEHQTGPTLWLFSPTDSLRHHLRFDTTLFQVLYGSSESLRVSGFLKQLSNVVVTKGKYEKAIQVNREILSVEPNNIFARRALAGILYDLGREEESLNEIQSTLHLDPNQADMWAIQGTLLLHLHRDREAELSLRQALALDRSIEYAYDNLLSIYVARRDKKNALDVLYRHYAILPPNSRKAQLIATDIRRLKQMPD